MTTHSSDYMAKRGAEDATDGLNPRSYRFFVTWGLTHLYEPYIRAYRAQQAKMEPTPCPTASASD